METLYLIPARGGSKGIPGKNIKLLSGKPLIHYSIEVALALSSKDNICVDTDDDEIAAVTQRLDLPVPFKRPAALASDTASMQDVLLHALQFYETQNRLFDAIVLLQPTSPLRKMDDVKAALSQYSSDLDMVMSVTETKANPYYVLFEEIGGYLVKSKEGNFETRQSAPKVYQANGAVYVISVKSLKEKSMKAFSRIKKTVMDETRSVDIDTLVDWEYCEFLISRGYNK
jgi:CMP-N,N'-diacetyllegionaminic acid synthase